MNILVLSKTNRTGGGASHMAEMHASALNTGEHQADFRPYYAESNARMQRSQKFNFKTLYPIPWADITGVGAIESYDLIHIHDTWATYSPLLIARLARKKPIFLTFHDTSAFTGGCMYPYDCKQYAEAIACTRCPSSQWPRVPKWAIRYKRKHYPRLPIYPSAPSNWMANMANQSQVFSTKTKRIGYYISDTFCPDINAKKALQLSNLPVVLVGTTTLLDPRKGGKYLLPILTELKKRLPSFQIISFGHQNPDSLKSLQIPHTHLGYIENEAHMAQAYQASDAYLFPSITDNSPITVMQSISCGTPVFTWNTGGTPELYENNRSGWHAELEDCQTLGKRLAEYLVKPADERACTRQAAYTFSQAFKRKSYIDAHLKWYTDSLQR